MKTRFLTLTACLLCCCATVQADDPVGRYVLMAGTFTTSTGEERRMILKIDTATGETWQYQSLSLDLGKSIASVEGWGIVTSNVDTAWKDLLKGFPNAKLAGPSPKK